MILEWRVRGPVLWRGRRYHVPRTGGMLSLEAPPVAAAISEAKIRAEG